MKPLSDRQILADYNQYSPARRILPLMMFQTLIGYFFRAIPFSLKSLYTWWGMGIQTYGLFVIFASGVYTWFFWVWGVPSLLEYFAILEFDIDGYLRGEQALDPKDFAIMHAVIVIIAGLIRYSVEWSKASELKASYKPLDLGRGFFEWIGYRRIWPKLSEAVTRCHSKSQ